MCVLLVEDDYLISMILTEVMTDAGFDVLDAPDAPSALALAEASGLPRIIVSDVNLGIGMNGSNLRHQFGRSGRRPFLLMSGRSDNFANRRSWPPQLFLLKPFSLDVFMRDVIALAN